MILHFLSCCCVPISQVQQCTFWVQFIPSFLNFQFLTSLTTFTQAFQLNPLIPLSLPLLPQYRMLSTKNSRYLMILMTSVYWQAWVWQNITTTLPDTAAETVKTTASDHHVVSTPQEWHHVPWRLPQPQHRHDDAERGDTSDESCFRGKITCDQRYWWSVWRCREWVTGLETESSVSQTCIVREETRSGESERRLKKLTAMLEDSLLIGLVLTGKVISPRFVVNY